MAFTCAARPVSSLATLPVQPYETGGTAERFLSCGQALGAVIVEKYTQLIQRDALISATWTASGTDHGRCPDKRVEIVDGDTPSWSASSFC